MGEEPEGRLHGEALSLEEIVALPVFEGCSQTLLKKNLGAVVRRTYAPARTSASKGSTDPPHS